MALLLPPVDAGLPGTDPERPSDAPEKNVNIEDLGNTPPLLLFTPGDEHSVSDGMGFGLCPMPMGWVRPRDRSSSLRMLTKVSTTVLSTWKGNCI